MFDDEPLPLDQLIPDRQLRVFLHHAFVFETLSAAVGHVGFFCRAEADWPRYMQARFIVHQQMAILRLGSAVGQAAAGMIRGRRALDLSARGVEVGGRSAVMIRMPHPEQTPCAYLVLAVLDVPATPFREATRAVLEWVHGQVERISTEDEERVPVFGMPNNPLGAFDQAGAVLFTVERLSDPLHDGVGVVCCQRPDGARINFSSALPAKEGALLEFVSEFIKLNGFPNQFVAGKALVRTAEGWLAKSIKPTSRGLGGG